MNNNARSYLTIFPPVATGGFGGLSPPKQISKTHKLKYEILYISGVFVNFYNVKQPCTNVKSPIVNFLATALTIFTSLCWV